MNYKLLKIEDLKSLYSNINFPTKPYYHQLVTFTFVLANNKNRIFLFHDIGLGKTLTSLYLLKLWNVKTRTLVICPNSVINTWIEQIKLHTDFTYCVLKGSKLERINKIKNENVNIYIINYEGLKLIGGQKIDNKYRVDIEQIKEIPFECIIADECHKFKNPFSLQTRIAYRFTQYCKHVILMTGTPIAKNAIDLFGQCLVLDNGKTFGKSYKYFLNYFYYKEYLNDYNWKPKRICNICGELYTKKTEHLKFHNIDISQYRENYPNEKTSESLILNAIKDFSVTFKREECIDLPEKVYEERIVYPTKEQQKWIREILEGIAIEEIERNIEYHVSKLFQIVGGAVIYEDGKHYIFERNPKINELLLLLEEISGKVIIYHSFIHEAKLISEALKKKGYKIALLNGQVKDKEEQIEYFEDEADILIAHPKSGGEGINLQFSNIEIFYNNGFIGTILREQAEGRIHRSGQTKTCLYIDIVMENTVDKVIYNSLKQKTDQMNEVLNYLQKAVKRIKQ